MRNHSLRNSTDQNRASEVYESADLARGLRQGQRNSSQNEELLNQMTKSPPIVINDQNSEEQLYLEENVKIIREGRAIE